MSPRSKIRVGGTLKTRCVGGEKNKSLLLGGTPLPVAQRERVARADRRRVITLRVRYHRCFVSGGEGEGRGGRGKEK